MFQDFFKKKPKEKDASLKKTLEKGQKLSKKAIGEYGEKLAAEYLLNKKYKILETNKRFSRACEIDIIALEKDMLVFVEVKTRSSEYCGSGFEAITKTKYKNIQTGLFTYLQENPKYKKFRIDVISIILKPEVKIEHLKSI
jgi:putative endonuclease